MILFPKRLLWCEIQTLITSFSSPLISPSNISLLPQIECFIRQTGTVAASKAAGFEAHFWRGNLFTWMTAAIYRGSFRHLALLKSSRPTLDIAADEEKKQWWLELSACMWWGNVKGEDRGRKVGRKIRGGRGCEGDVVLTTQWLLRFSCEMT